MKTKSPILIALICGASLAYAAPIDIGSRRELLVDDYLIDSMDGAHLQLHHPVQQDIAITHDAPWEGSGCGYHSIFQDGDKYRMYYKAWQLTVKDNKLKVGDSHFTCYAESDDGIHWTKPNLGLVEYPKGSGDKNNNIVIGLYHEPWMKDTKPDAVHPAVFLDTNPDCPEDARYKAILRSRGEKGVLALKSPDGLRWSLIADKPVITDGAFDSQNLAFWDPVRNEYRAYWRIFTDDVRSIRTAVSKDMVNWTDHEDLQYVNSKLEHLYTNQVQPYYRAPHLYIGFPTRYVERGWNKSMEALPEAEHRKMRSAVTDRYGMAITEALFMSSRDGVTFNRWAEAFLRPGIERKGTWHYGHQYIGWQVVETESALEGAPNELSLYATESYWTGTSDKLRRYTMRLDGFTSASAPFNGGSFTTKPVIFNGNQLSLNFSSSAAGGIRVEIRDEEGNVIPGYTAADCDEVFGDSIERSVYWKDKGSDVSGLAGKPVRLHFILRDADLFSFRFRMDD